MPTSSVFFDKDDPGMHRASANARATFKYFWRELSWEYRRVIPGLDVAAVKVAFSDGDPGGQVEHMWVGEVGFDGRVVSGMLLNEPNWLKSVHEGDEVDVPLDRVGDWMYAIGGRVYGGHTVSLMRSRMSPAERQAHDSAWGLDFGTPGAVVVVPPTKSGAPGDPDAEHPMSENMAPSMREQITKDRSLLTVRDDRGWTFLHQLALAGSAAGVRTLLDLGADRTAKTTAGQTARDLAESLAWPRVIALLE